MYECLRSSILYGDNNMIAKVPLDLLNAVRSKGIRLMAWAKDSFRETLLHLKNESLNELQIDVSRSALKAKTGKSQRIGLSYPVGSRPGDHILILKSGQEKEIVFNSRCLDKQGNPPGNGSEYKLVPDLLANYVSELLRQGAEQHEVWDAIKDRSGEIIVRSEIPAMIDKFEKPFKGESFEN
jgi:hypothetical protein